MGLTFENLLALTRIRDGLPIVFAPSLPILALFPWKWFTDFFFLDYFKIQNIIDKIITSFQWLLFYYNTILFFLNNLYTISSNFIVISMKMIYRFFLDFLRILVQNVIDKINPFNTISIKYFPPLFVTRFLNSLEHYKILT